MVLEHPPGLAARGKNENIAPPCQVRSTLSLYVTAMVPLVPGDAAPRGAGPGEAAPGGHPPLQSPHFFVSLKPKPVHRPPSSESSGVRLSG